MKILLERQHNHNLCACLNQALPAACQQTNVVNISVLSTAAAFVASFALSRVLIPGVNMFLTYMGWRLQYAVHGCTGHERGTCSLKASRGLDIHMYTCMPKQHFHSMIPDQLSQPDNRSGTSLLSLEPDQVIPLGIQRVLGPKTRSISY
jgi:hypothetical protein